MKGLLLFSLLLRPAVGRAQTFSYDGHANCEKGYPGTTAMIPANSLLLAADSNAKSTFPFLDMAKVTARVNELLKGYGLGAIEAKEFKYSTYESMPFEAYDHAFNFRRNSYLMRLVTQAGSPAGSTEACELDKGVPGYRKTKSCYNDLHVKLGEVKLDMAAPSDSGADDNLEDRQRAILAVLIVHEFVHGVMDRMIVESAVGSADNDGGCKPEVAADALKKRSSALHTTLAICAGARHQSAGLMTAGGSLTGDPCSDVGFTSSTSKTMQRCFFEKGLAASAYKSLAAGPNNSGKCQGTTVGAFLKLPQAPLIASYLSKRASKACYDACYYAAKK